MVISHLSEEEKVKVLHFAETVIQDVPQGLLLMASQAGVNCLEPGKMQGYVGDVLYVVRKIWEELETATKSLHTYQVGHTSNKEGIQLMKAAKPHEMKPSKKRVGNDQDSGFQNTTTFVLKKKGKRTEESQSTDTDIVPADFPPLLKRTKGSCQMCGSNCFMRGPQTPPKCLQHY